MNVIICVDDNNGMMFNRRRQSMDAAVRNDILKTAEKSVLWMNLYSRMQFDGTPEGNIKTDPDFLNLAKRGDYCFVENKDVVPYEKKIEKLILYRWNRKYPADQFLTLDLGKWRMESAEEFAGHSHKKITKEIYIK